MLSSKTVVEAYMEHQEKATYTPAELEVYIVPATEGNGEEMEVEPENGGGLEVRCSFKSYTLVECFPGNGWAWSGNTQPYKV